MTQLDGSDLEVVCGGHHDRHHREHFRDYNYYNGFNYERCVRDARADFPLDSAIEGPVQAERNLERKLWICRNAY